MSNNKSVYIFSNQLNPFSDLSFTSQILMLADTKETSKKKKHMASVSRSIESARQQNIKDRIKNCPRAFKGFHILAFGESKCPTCGYGL